MSRLLCCVMFWSVPLLLSPAHACLWDSDTLATEAEGLPDVVQIITGRFPRNPPLFYEMRLARVSKEVQAQPAKLELYDDAAVACDRLHRSREAIAWMAKKRAQLKPFPQDKEHWYRYHANLGTFQAHDWLRSGANRKNISQMKSARDHIARAIKINPDAHFGREKYQLMAMDWIVEPLRHEKSDGRIDEMPSFMEFGIDEKREESRATQIANGLAGLIVLGDAWESLDVFIALRNAMSARRAPTAYLASLRCEELVERGKKSLCPSAPIGRKLLELIQLQASYIALEEGRRPDIRGQYSKLRLEAEDFQMRRNFYMLERLKAGRHPDTDANFWKDWYDSGPPVIDDLPPLTSNQILQRILIGLFAFISALIIAAVVCWRVWRKRRRLAA